MSNYIKCYTCVKSWELGQIGLLHCYTLCEVIVDEDSSDIRDLLNQTVVLN